MVEHTFVSLEYYHTVMSKNVLQLTCYTTKLMLNSVLFVATVCKKFCVVWVPNLVCHIRRSTQCGCSTL